MTSGLFQEMVACADLLDAEIYEIQEVWTVWRDLWYANGALKSLPKGLQFFCPMSPSEMPKVMGLKGIHHPNALHCHVGLSYCPWCGKEGKNKGTIVNHLQTTHHKLKLVCSQCLCFPVITSEAIWHHGPALAWKRKMEGLVMRTHPHQTNQHPAIIHPSGTHHTIMCLN